MGNSDSRISSLLVKQEEIKCAGRRESGLYTPPFRKFQIQAKKNKKNMENLVRVTEPYEQSFSLNNLVYHQLREAFEEKTEQISIQNVFFDEENTDRWLYQICLGVKKKSMILRPFRDYTSHIFGNMLCEVHFNELIRNINSPNLHIIEDSYVVEMGIQDSEAPLPNTFVLIMEPVATNLSEIISYRRRNKWEWTELEFKQLTRDLLEGLGELHTKGISHNDIRPSTVYYSSEKNCYLLGSFANCLKNQGNKSTMRIRSSKYFNAPELSNSKKTDLLSGDVYSLGVTLLCALYLCEPIDLQSHQRIGKSFFGKYDIFSILNSMIPPSQQRKSVQDILSQFKQQNYTYKNMGHLIESLRNLNRPDPISLAHVKTTFSQGYQRLGLWNEWKTEYLQGTSILEPTFDEHHKAEIWRKLAFIDYCRGDYEESSQNAKKASIIYRKLGHRKLDEGNIGLAESYFNWAMKCSEYYENDIELARVLQGLAEVHCEKAQYTQSKVLLTEAVTKAGKLSDKDSIDCIRIRIREAKLQTDFGQYEQANQILSECLKSANRKSLTDPKQIGKLLADIHMQIGRTRMKRASYEEQQTQKQEQLAKAEESTKQAYNTMVKIDEDNHDRMADIMAIFGEIYFKRGQYELAVENFQKSLELIKFCQQIKKFNLRERGDLLCKIGSCQTLLRDHQQAIVSYEDALSHYKSLYGTDHTRHSALAFGNLARVYTNLKEKVKARQCLRCAINMLHDLLGPEDPDYVHFKSIQEKLDTY